MRALPSFWQPLPPVEGRADLPSGPDWKQANPLWIEKSLRRALARPSGGWYVLDASRSIGDGPQGYQVAGRPLVAWRNDGAISVAPEACPHMGASLCDGRVEAGMLVCPWHGLALGDRPRGKWRPLPVFDDGVLTWIRVPSPGEEPLASPVIAERPHGYIDAVMRMDASCEPEDVVANRLDPWHGVHFHPYAFGSLKVIDISPDDITVRVAYRVGGPFRVEVDARFHSPEPRTIAMTILRGEGEGSVVETHATPISHGRTAIIEATLATSERRGFRVARHASWLLRPLIRRAARRLWVDDAAYAERRYALRMSAE